jgi:hypothetical protein
MEQLVIVSDEKNIALSRDGQTFWLDAEEAQQVIEVLSVYVKKQGVVLGAKTSGKK